MAFFNALRRGVFYSKSTLIDIAQPLHSLKLNKLRRISRRPISEINKRVVNFRYSELDEATINLSKHTIIFVVNTGSRVSAVGMSSLLATHSATTGKQVALIDVTQDQKVRSPTKKDIESFDMKFEDSEFGVSTLNINNDIHKTSFFASKALEERIHELLAKFDQIFISVKDEEAFSRVRMLEQFKPKLVVLSGIKKTQKKYIQMLKQKLPIEIMFHE